MSALKCKTASLWHAFQALRDRGKPGSSRVAKGQLKVFTHNMASAFGLTSVENELEKRFSEDQIEFDEYISFLSECVFPLLSDGSVVDVSRTGADTLCKVDELCWFICSKVYGSTSETRSLGDLDLYDLWRVFNALAETESNSDDDVLLPVVMHIEEIEYVIQRLGVLLRSPVTYTFPRHSGIMSESMSPSIPPFSPTTDIPPADPDTMSFTQFLYVVETQCFAGKDKLAVSTAVTELYEEIIINVLKKGYLQRRGGHGVTSNNEQGWYVLTPSKLRYFSRRDETEKKGEMAITNSCRVENLSDKSGMSIGGIGFGAKANRFALFLSDSIQCKPVEFLATDSQTKSEWIQALRTAIGWAGVMSSPYFVELRKRRSIRAERRARRKLEEQRKHEEQERMARTLEQLELERKAREDAERRCEEEARLLELERQRIAELEELYRQVEALLERERQAKRDEELVRALQAKVLAEEFEKREQLEQLKLDLEQLLLQEHEKTAGLEERRRLQEQQLREEQQRLARLEQERKQRDLEYEMAVAKLQEAERAKLAMQDELIRKEGEIRKHKPTNYIFPRSGPNVPASPAPINTHRGVGAFTDADFVPRARNDSSSSSAVTSPGGAMPSTPSPRARPRRGGQLGSASDGGSLDHNDGAVASSPSPIVPPRAQPRQPRQQEQLQQQQQVVMGTSFDDGNSAVGGVGRVCHQNEQEMRTAQNSHDVPVAVAPTTVSAAAAAPGGNSDVTDDGPQGLGRAVVYTADRQSEAEDVFAHSHMTSVARDDVADDHDELRRKILEMCRTSGDDVETMENCCQPVADKRCDDFTATTTTVNNNNNNNNVNY